jgi:cystathionine gamma-synthase
MAAIFAIYRIVTAASPGRKTLQLCFPYVDALKVQEHFGTGVDFVPLARGEQLAEAISAIRKGNYAAVFCEVPSNPLLNTVDLRVVSEACRASGTPLIVDDTVCSHLNLDVLPYADAITTSLTKWVSGIGDVMAGAVKLSFDSPHHESLRSTLEMDVPGGSKLYGRDAEVLMANARGLTERVRIANAHSEPVAEFLAAHPAIEKVWYPKFTDREVYDALRHPTGGYGGLLSFTLNNPERAPEVYNAIRLSKGPSLGTEYSLVCPYTLLTHYEELEWAESCGVSRNLLRLSVGKEDPGDLIKIFADALEHA